MDCRVQSDGVGRLVSEHPSTTRRAALAALENTAAEGLMSPEAIRNINIWLTDPRYAEYTPLVADEIVAERWKTLDDVFWTIIPFGTAGRRGVRGG